MTLIRAYDVQAGENYPGPNEAWLDAFHAWVEAHGIVKEDTDRIEYHLLDAPFIRVFQVDRDENGRLRTLPFSGGIARRKPYDVPVTSEPPKVEDYP